MQWLVRNRLSLEVRAAVFVLGVLSGCVLGYIMMGTAHAMFESRAAQHAGGAAATSGSTARSGAVSALSAASRSGKLAGRTIHTVITSNGSPYQNIQGRIMYASYKLVQAMPGGDALTGFTRLMHRMKDDEIMDDIPTFRVDSLHPECDTWCDFPVADRPDAVRKWIAAVDANPSLLQGDWIFMAECDYVWMKPLAAPGPASDPAVRAIGFWFDYIIPNHEACRNIIRRLFNGGDPALVPASGPAPVVLRFSELKAIVPGWEQITAKIEASDEAKKVLDWIREMYAWDVALALSGVKMDIQAQGNTSLIAQPPHDLYLGNASLTHYTWGVIYHENGKEIWKFDKRFYTDPKHALRVPQFPMPPEWREGIKLQDGLPVGRDLHAMVVAMVGQMNRASASLRDLSSRMGSRQ